MPARPTLPDLPKPTTNYRSECDYAQDAIYVYVDLGRELARLNLVDVALGAEGRRGGTENDWHFRRKGT